MKHVNLTILVVGLAVIFLGITRVDAQQTNLPMHEMTIEVQTRILAMPGGADSPIAKAPIRMARVRNTEMRNLNAQFNAVYIEKVFEVQDPEDVSLGQSALTSGQKKKTKFEGKRIVRKTERGFAETDRNDSLGAGKIVKGKFLDLKERKESSSADMLMAQESVISEEDIKALANTYILIFQDYLDADGNLVQINMDEVLAAYNALPVVVSAVNN